MEWRSHCLDLSSPTLGCLTEIRSSEQGATSLSAPFLVFRKISHLNYQFLNFPSFRIPIHRRSWFFCYQWSCGVMIVAEYFMVSVNLNSPFLHHDYWELSTVQKGWWLFHPHKRISSASCYHISQPNYHKEKWWLQILNNKLSEILWKQNTRLRRLWGHTFKPLWRLEFLFLITARITLCFIPKYYLLHILPYTIPFLPNLHIRLLCLKYIWLTYQHIPCKIF